MSEPTDDELLAGFCQLCRSRVTDCGCVLGKSPQVHAALARRYPGYRNPCQPRQPQPGVADKQ